MTSFESPVKTIPAAIETVFDTLSDFSNLERLRDKIPEDKVQNFNCDPDKAHSIPEELRAGKNPPPYTARIYRLRPVVK